MSYDTRQQNAIETIYEAMEEVKATPKQVAAFSHFCNVNKETREIWPDRFEGGANRRRQDVEDWAREQTRWDLGIVLSSFHSDLVDDAVNQIKQIL